MKNIEYMKRTLLFWLGVVTVILTFAACEDNREDNLVDDTVYLMKSGAQKYDLKRNDAGEYTVTVYKAGPGCQDAKADIIIDPAVLEEYNTTYGTSLKMLPEDVYTLGGTEVSLAKEDVSKSILVTLKGVDLYDLCVEKYGLDNAFGHTDYALPIRIKVTGAKEAEASRMSAILIPTLKR